MLKDISMHRLVWMGIDDLKHIVSCSCWLLYDVEKGVVQIMNKIVSVALTTVQAYWTQRCYEQVAV